MNFIEQYPDALSAEYCDELIELFEGQADRHDVGRTSSGVNLDVKDSVEIFISEELLEEDRQWADVVERLGVALNAAVDDYKAKYPMIEEISTWALTLPINFQRFNPGQGFKKWHCEVGGHVTATRTLVWMLYLNTVEDRRGTDFLSQEFTCKAEAGKLVIWPPYWTHFHRSQVSPSETKYILTGWMHFI